MNGKWIIFWDSGTYSQRLCSFPKQVVKETEKLIKFSRSGSWPRQVDKSDVIAAYETEADASDALDKAQAAYTSSYNTMSNPVNDAQSRLNDAISARKKAVIFSVTQAVS
ncbi:hypothetical protein ACLJYM_06330 [Rhizobium giardinii]|uniref:hypothetical protein n=1 Tax=Rhizobium giardinii TaxID=56731 RepID=UPI0039DFEA6C